MTDRTLRDQAVAALAAYDRANPMRTADWHGDDCDCFRCEMDRLRALLDAHAAEQPADLQLSASKVGSAPQDQTGVSTAPDAVAEAQAWRDVQAERQRQINAEGWDDIHDDMNDRSELAQAAACYALSGTPADEAVFIHGRWKDPRDLFWPHSWSKEWWKPTDRRRDLVKAGALILAEIERLDRAAKEPRP